MSALESNTSFCIVSYRFVLYFIVSHHIIWYHVVSTYGVHICMLMMIPIIYKMSDIMSNIVLNVRVIVIFSSFVFVKVIHL